MKSYTKRGRNSDSIDLDRFCLILALVGALLQGVRVSGEGGNIREKNCLCLCLAVGSIWIFHSILSTTAGNLNNHSVSWSFSPTIQFSPFILCHPHLCPLAQYWLNKINLLFSARIIQKLFRILSFHFSILH